VKGDIPPGTSVPWHSHPEPESFLVVSGRGEVLVERDGRLGWIAVWPGDYVNVPGGTKHAHRNTSSEPLVELATTTATLGRFFEEIGRPLDDTARIEPPTAADFERFQAVAAKYGHRLASPEEIAAVGLTMPGPTGAP